MSALIHRLFFNNIGFYQDFRTNLLRRPLLTVDCKGWLVSSSKSLLHLILSASSFKLYNKCKLVSCLQHLRFHCKQLGSTKDFLDYPFIFLLQKPLVKIHHRPRSICPQTFTRNLSWPVAARSEFCAIKFIKIWSELDLRSTEISAVSLSLLSVFTNLCKLLFWPNPSWHSRRRYVPTCPHFSKHSRLFAKIGRNWRSVWKRIRRQERITFSFNPARKSSPIQSHL